MHQKRLSWIHIICNLIYLLLTNYKQYVFPLNVLTPHVCATNPSFSGETEVQKGRNVRSSQQASWTSSSWRWLRAAAAHAAYVYGGRFLLHGVSVLQLEHSGGGGPAALIDGGSGLLDFLSTDRGGALRRGGYTTVLSTSEKISWYLTVRETSWRS